MKNKLEVIDAEIIEETASSEIYIGSTVSAVEKLADVNDYDDLIRKIDNYGIEDLGFQGDGKSYWPEISKVVWVSTIKNTKPILPKDDKEREKLESIYKLLLTSTFKGEYPLMSQLCAYLGLTMNEFKMILNNEMHPDSRVYRWAYALFDNAASQNALRGNGSNSARQWIDKTREDIITAAERFEIVAENNRIKALSDDGERIAQMINMEQMEVDDD